MKNVLIVGGAGYIGSHVNKILNEKGYQTIVLDNLVTGNSNAVTRGSFIQGDMGNPSLLDNIFKENKIDAVMHFAASTDVGESVQDPGKYYTNNVANTLTLLNSMVAHHVKVLIFSSTAAIFGIPVSDLIDESHPAKPINPYGASKLFVEKILHDFDHAYGLRYCALRYFNAAGGDPDGEVKAYKQKENNLIPIILKNLRNNNATVTIFGDDYPTRDGTCIRDYVHILDLAQAHLSGLESLLNGGSSCSYNLGNGQGYTVREVIQAVEEVTGREIHAVKGGRRPGDPPILLANSAKAQKELHWTPQYPELHTIIQHAWNSCQV